MVSLFFTSSHCADTIGYTTTTFPGARVAAVWDKPKAGPNTKGVEDSKLAGVEDSKGAGVDGPKGVKGTTLCGVETPKAPML